jgi:hypothetical protein
MTLVSFDSNGIITFTHSIFNDFFLATHGIKGYNVALCFSESCIGTAIAILIILFSPEPKQAKK